MVEPVVALADPTDRATASNAARTAVVLNILLMPYTSWMILSWETRMARTTALPASGCREATRA